jgi:hypothetical protein
MPPRFLGYDNFLYKFGLDGSPYVGPDQATLGKYAHWLWLLSSARFLKNHSVLCYHDGIKAALKSP